MKIAFSVNEPNSKALVEHQFGPGGWYAFYDSQSRALTYVENPARHPSDKIGCESAEFLVSQGVEMAIAGRFGFKAVEVFRKNRIQMVIPDKQKSINEIIKQIKE